MSDGRAFFIEYFVVVAGDAALRHLKSDQGSFQSRCFSLLKSLAPDEPWLLHFAEAVKPCFPHIDGIGNFVPVEGERAFEAQRVARAQATRDCPEFFTSLQHVIPC